MKADQVFLEDTGERIIPPQAGEVSLVFARHQFAYQWAGDLVAGAVVLDVGCGTGYGCLILAQRAGQVVGIDHDFSAVVYSHQNYGRANISHCQMSAHSLGLKASQFDVTVCFQTIEHLRTPDQFIAELKRVVKPGGKIIISTPNVPAHRTRKRFNPFHEQDLDFDAFQKLVQKHFVEFELIGVVYRSKNLLRLILQKLPLYRWGARLKRKSLVKNIAAKSLSLTNFQMTATDVTTALDLVAVCTNT